MYHWTFVFEDRKTGKLGYATVKVADAVALAPEASREVADAAVTRALGWPSTGAPYGELTPHREPVRVYVTAPDGTAELRMVFLGDEEEPTAAFRLTPSRRQEVTA